MVGADPWELLPARCRNHQQPGIARIPKPRVNLTRSHGLFAPNGNLCAMVRPGKRGRTAGFHEQKNGHTTHNPLEGLKDPLTGSCRTH